MATSSPRKKIIEVQANATTPRGATIKLTVEYRIRPPIPTESGPLYQDVSMEKTIDVNMGIDGQYKQEAKYKYGTETDNITKYSTIERSNIDKENETILVPEQIVEHISEDEKSTSSEEVVFEEWSEEFFCRRTDEYDRNTNKLIRSTIDETSERIKGDVIKEEYKEKNVRIKGHKSYDVVKDVYRRVPANTLVPIDQVQTHLYEEISQPPPSSIKPTTMSSSTQDRHWTSEDIYTTEIVYDPNLAKDITSTAQKFDSSSLTNYGRTHSGRYSPIQSTTQAIISTTIPSSHYEHMSNIVTSTPHYVDKRKKEDEEIVSEEYQVEIETPKKRDETTGEDIIDDQKSSNRRNSDWRTKLKQIYSPTSDDDRFDQLEKQYNGHYTAQRATVIPTNIQQRFKEVQVKIPEHDKTSFEQRKLESSPPSRRTVKEVLVSISRGSSPEKQYPYSSIDKKKRLTFTDYETPKKFISTSPTDDDRRQPPKRTQFELDRPSFGRVGELKNAFETTTTTTTNGSYKDDTSKYKTSITTGLTEQRRRMFEEQEQTRRPIDEYYSTERRMSETHTGPSLVNDRISRIESIEPKSTSRIQSSDRLGRAGFDAIRTALESSITKTTTPQTSIDITIKNKQIISSIDSDFNGSSKPIYQSTPKTIKQKYDDDAGHESEDELSEPKQTYDTRRYTSKTRVRDFSQSTSQPIDSTYLNQRPTIKFNETDMENILSHVPTSKGKGILIELSPNLSQSPTKSNLTTDSGIFDYSTGTSQYLRTSSPSWRHNVSTSIMDDPTRTGDNGVYIDSIVATSRKISDEDQTTLQNVDDSISRSTYKYDAEIFPSEPINQQQRIVRRQITKSPSTDYENLTNYHSRIDTHSKIPLTTQSRSIKPLLIDEIETVETETHVECQVQRTHETKESTKTERTTSPISSTTKIHTTISHSPYSSSDEIIPSKRVLLNERPQYYESPKPISSSIQEETRFKPIERDYSQDSLRYSPSSYSKYTTGPHKMEVTSLSPKHQITFGKNSPNEIIAVVRVPQLSDDKITSSSTIRHGRSESELYEKLKQDEERPRLHYQRVHATSYLPPLINRNYQQRINRSQAGPLETTNDYSSPINYPTRSASYHSSLYEQNQQQQKQQQQSYSPPSKLTYHPQTRYHSGSLNNLFGSNLDFEIEIEKRPPQRPEQPTIVSLDQSSRAIVTTSKDGRVSIQNIAAYPGNTVTINSDFHSSDRSLNRSSGYFSSDEPRSQPFNKNYSSDELSTDAKQTYHFDRINDIVHQYSRPSNTSTGFNETIDQIDALYNNLDIQTNNKPYDFSKPISTINRRKELSKNSNDYSKRYTSTGFQQISDDQNMTSSSLTNLVMGTPIRPSQSLSSSGILADYGTSDSISPNSGYGSIQNIVYQNRLNKQSQVVQRNRPSVKQVKQKSAAKRRNANI